MTRQVSFSHLLILFLDPDSFFTIPYSLSSSSCPKLPEELSTLIVSVSQALLHPSNFNYHTLHCSCEATFSKSHQWFFNWYAQQSFYHHHSPRPSCVGRLFFTSVFHGLYYSTISKLLEVLRPCPLHINGEGLWNIYPNSNLYQHVMLTLLQYQLFAQICKWAFTKPPFFLCIVI